MNNKVSGYTIIEILIAIAIFVLVSGIVLSFQNDLFSVNNFLEESFRIQGSAEELLREMISELREAAESNLGGYPLEITGNTSLAFYSNIDKDPLKERVHYFLEGNELKKSIVKSSGFPLTYSTSTANESLRVVLRNIQSTSTVPIFSYFPEFISGTTTPLAQPVDPAAVKMVHINISIDEDLNRLPPEITVSSRVLIRNLKK